MKQLKKVIGTVAACALAAAIQIAAGQTGQEKIGDLIVGGQLNAPLRIEVFSDFQCPSCRAFYLETIKPLIADFTKEKKIDRICIIYHDFPLDIHPYARKAASYDIAAGRIGREARLKVTDTLYQEQNQWAANGDIDAVLAKVLGPTDLARVKQLAADPSVTQAVQAEVQLGKTRDITVTPTFFVITEAGRQERSNGPVALPIVKGRVEYYLK